VFHYLDSLPNIAGVIKSRRMRWVGHAGCIKEMRYAAKILARKLEREHTTLKTWA
jgi:hypothetical protein